MDRLPLKLPVYSENIKAQNHCKRNIQGVIMSDKFGIRGIDNIRTGKKTVFGGSKISMQYFIFQQLVLFD